MKQITLTPPYGDGMVLQRHSRIMLKGCAPRGTVTVRLLGGVYEAQADERGAWSAYIEPQAAGGPHTLTVEAGGQTLTVRDVYFGDVWLCGGQSNMELTMRRVKNRFPEDMNAHNPMIRQCFVPQECDFQGPRDTLRGGHWAALTPDTVWDFSAVGYFFAQNIHATQNVPVGLLYAAVGGTPVQAWMRRETLAPEMLETADRYCGEPGLVERIQRDDQERINAFHHKLGGLDEGVSGHWYTEDYDDSAWPERELCVPWSDGEGLTQPGVIWFRNTVHVPEGMRGQPAKLFLGCVVDSDTAYADGVQIGSIGYRYPPREYDFKMPDKESVTIAVRVSAHENQGGFVPGKPYKIVCGGGEIDLSGPWRYRRGASCERIEPQTFINRAATGLYNGMIAPLHSFPIKGILFYQGESNTGEPRGYGELFCKLIEDWRLRWNSPELPFLYVQIANYKTPDSGENWAELRHQQRMALTLTHTAMIATLDCGEDNDLHPTDKRTVGLRLAAAAKRLAYGQSQLPAEPEPCRVTREGHALTVNFAVKLKAPNGKPEGFDICGSDEVYHPAGARIDGDAIILESAEVAEPTGVRYAWSDAPKASVFSESGDPLGTFRAAL